MVEDTTIIYNIPIFVFLFLLFAFLFRTFRTVGFLICGILGFAFSLAGTQYDLDLYINPSKTIYEHFFANLGGDLLANLILIFLIIGTDFYNDSIQGRVTVRFLLIGVVLLLCQIVFLSMDVLIDNYLIYIEGIKFDYEIFYNLILELLIIPVVLVILNILDMVANFISIRGTPNEKVFCIGGLISIIFIIAYFFNHINYAVTTFLPYQYTLLGALLTALTVNEIFVQHSDIHILIVITALYGLIFSVIIFTDLPSTAKISILTELLSTAIFLYMLPPRKKNTVLISKLVSTQ